MNDQLLCSAITDESPSAWDELATHLQTVAHRGALSSRQVRRRLQRVRLPCPPPEAPLDQVRDAIENTGDFGSQLLDRIDNRLFGEVARQRLTDLIRRRARVSGKLGPEAVKWVVTVYVVAPALEASDRSTSTRKSLEAQFRAAKDAGLVDEVIAVYLLDEEGWRERLDKAREEGLVGSGPVAAWGNRRVLFTDFAQARGGGAYGIVGSSRVIGLPGLLARVQQASDPVEAFRTLEKADFLDCVRASQGVARIVPAPPRHRGRREQLPRNEVHRVFGELLRRLDRPVARVRFFGAIYDRLLPGGPAFGGTLAQERAASLQGRVVEPDAHAEFAPTPSSAPRTRRTSRIGRPGSARKLASFLD